MVEIGLKINGESYGWMRAHSWGEVEALWKQLREMIESEEAIATASGKDIWKV